MQLEGLTIALRTRTPWEATDLGIALVRAHAARIYAAWVLITLPVFALLNVYGAWLGKPWVAALLLWWLKPVFDRIPMFVISRAVFGTVPSLRETLRAQRNWGWRGAWRWMHWRRFLHPGRAMLLGVDLLEGVSGAQRAERVHVLTRAHASPNAMLTLLGINIEGMLTVAIVLLGLMFVPAEFLSESAKAVWSALIEQPPLWAQVLLNFFGWIAMSVVEPFYVGAGFGLYLNRRMQLEGWDIELAFRRLGARLSAPLAAAALLLIALALAPPLSRAADVPCVPVSTSDAPDDDDSTSLLPCKKADRKEVKSLDQLFTADYHDGGDAFAKDVTHAYADADLSPSEKQFVWKRRHPDDDETKPQAASPFGKGFGSVLGFIAQFGLWIVLAVLLGIVLYHHKRWLSWLADRVPVSRAPDALELREQVKAEQLPDDVPAAVRALLQQRKLRAALALLYRAAVARLIEQLGAPLPPGATESDCLRQSRRLRDTRFAALFARIVRSWQAAAYAQRLPQAAEIEQLLVEWSAPAEVVA